MQTSQQQNTPKLFHRASRKQRFIAALVCIAIVGFFGFFGIAGYKNIDLGIIFGRCGFKQSTGLPCPTCGFTTAAKSFAQGKILQAFYIQPAAAFFYSIFVVAAIFAFIIAIFGIYFNFIKRLFTEIKIRHIILALLIVVVAGWAVTLARAVVQQS